MFLTSRLPGGSGFLRFINLLTIQRKASPKARAGLALPARMWCSSVKHSNFTEYQHHLYSVTVMDSSKTGHSIILSEQTNHRATKWPELQKWPNASLVNRNDFCFFTSYIVSFYAVFLPSKWNWLRINYPFLPLP